MKFYILCDIEGVASLTCWDEARSVNACYAPMARAASSREWSSLMMTE